MIERTAPQPRLDSAPVDVETIRAAARDVLTGDARLDDQRELETVCRLLRGVIRLLAPEVEILAGRWPKGHIPAICARACVGEARARLRLGLGENAAVRLSVAQKLARTTLALVDHWEGLQGPA